MIDLTQLLTPTLLNTEDITPSVDSTTLNSVEDGLKESLKDGNSFLNCILKEQNKELSIVFSNEQDVTSSIVDEKSASLHEALPTTMSDDLHVSSDEEKQKELDASTMAAIFLHSMQPPSTHVQYVPKGETPRASVPVNDLDNMAYGNISDFLDLQQSDRKLNVVQNDKANFKVEANGVKPRFLVEAVAQKAFLEGSNPISLIETIKSAINIDDQDTGMRQLSDEVSDKPIPQAGSKTIQQSDAALKDSVEALGNFNNVARAKEKGLSILNQHGPGKKVNSDTFLGSNNANTSAIGRYNSVAATGSVSQAPAKRGLRITNAFETKEPVEFDSNSFDDDNTSLTRVGVDAKATVHKLQEAITVKSESITNQENSQTNVPELMTQVSSLVRQGGGKMSVSLNPPELGRVDVEVIAKGKKIEIEMKSSSEKVKSLLESHVSQLKGSMQAHDLVLSKFDIQVRREGSFASTDFAGSDPGNQFSQGFRQSTGQQGSYSPRQSAFVPTLSPVQSVRTWTGSPIQTRASGGVDLRV